jgi:hypothetical protein
MWTIVFGAITLIFFLLGLTMPGSFNPFFLIMSMSFAVVFGFAAAIDLGRWKQEHRDRDPSQPKREPTEHHGHA